MVRLCVVICLRSIEFSNNEVRDADFLGEMLSGVKELIQILRVLCTSSSSRSTSSTTLHSHFPHLIPFSVETRISSVSVVPKKIKFF